jgi:hypothetical protein
VNGKKSLTLDELIVGNPAGQHLKLTANGVSLHDGMPGELASLCLDRGLPAFILCDRNGRPRVKISIYRDGTPEIQFLDGNEQARMDMGVSQIGTPYLAMLDGEQQKRLEIAVDTDTLPYLRLCAEDEDKRGVLSLTQDDEPYLAAYTAEGQEMWRLPKGKLLAVTSAGYAGGEGELSHGNQITTERLGPDLPDLSERPHGPGRTAAVRQRIPAPAGFG